MDKKEINVLDYLNEDEIRDICVNYIQDRCYNFLRDNNEMERILSNMAYSAAFRILDSVLTPEMLEHIKIKTKKHLESDSAYGIFRRRDYWNEQEDSPAYVAQYNAMQEHKHLISPLVKKAILERDYSQDLDDVTVYMSDLISDALKKAFCRGIDDE